MRTRDRIGIEPRRQARQRTKAVLLSPQIVVGSLVTAGVLVVLIVGTRSLIGLTGHGWNPTVFEFVFGAFVVSVPWTTGTLVVMVDGSWSWRIGAIAERRTAEVLGRLGPQWRQRHNMVFYGGRIDDKTWITDIDCVTIGPGGVYAVSTKWTSDRWDLADPSDPWLLAAAGRASANADLLARQIRYAVGDTPVVPVVVCWGPQLEPIPRVVTHIDLGRRNQSSVRVVSGYQADEWLPRLSGKRLDTEAVSAVDAVVADWIDQYESRHRRTAEARENLRRRLHRAGLASIASSALSVAVTASWIAAVFDRSVLRDLDRFAKLGRGSGAAALLLLPLILPAAAALVRQRLDSQSQLARLPTNRVPAFIALGAAMVFVATFIATLLLA